MSFLFDRLVKNTEVRLDYYAINHYQHEPSTASLPSVSNHKWFIMNSFASLYTAAFDILILGALLVGSSIKKDEGYISYLVAREAIKNYHLHHSLKDINENRISHVYQ